MSAQPPAYTGKGSSAGSNASVSLDSNTTGISVSNGNGASATNVTPGPVRGSLSTLSPQSVQVSAVCSNDGVNVTVTSSQVQNALLCCTNVFSIIINLQPYTGAVYAAERFSFCRNLVTSQNSFWLFLPRPNVNSACNTILVVLLMN